MTGAQASARVVVIVVFDGVKLLDAAGPAEVFAEANRFGANYRLEIASVDGRDVTTSIGTRFTVTGRISSIDSADTVVVAGGDKLVGGPIDPALVEALKTIPARSRRLASVCTGSFILAQAGLLSGRRATTHWRHTRLLARAFPLPREKARSPGLHEHATVDPAVSIRTGNDPGALCRNGPNRCRARSARRRSHRR